MGKCPDCGAWDTLEGTTASTSKAAATPSWSVDEAITTDRRAIPLPEIKPPTHQRLATGLAEFDRVLGGGLVPGSVVLLGGEPGIGKSTLLLQAAARLAAAGRAVLYVSSEESGYQTRLRAERLTEVGATVDRLDGLHVLADTDLNGITEQARRIRPAVLVLDSIQMVHQPALDASPGSAAQLRRCCLELVALAKLSGMAIVVVGHVTKEGQLAGPKLLEHIVDAVLSFEGDRHHAHRVVRGMKNRFGPTLEVGLFEMTARGLREVEDAELVGDPEAPPTPGSVFCPVVHGSRSLLVEIQALTATGFPGSAKRRTSGLDGNRLAMLIAVLEQHGELRLADQDIFASAAGGLRVAEAAADLAVSLAVAGAHRRHALPPGTVALGEVSLGGEVRHPDRIEQRLREAARLGFRRVIMRRPHDRTGARTTLEIEVIAVTRIEHALAILERPRQHLPIESGVENLLKAVSGDERGESGENL